MWYSRLINIVIILAFFPLFGYGQLPKKAKKFVGIWQHTEDSGFEVWRMDGDKLVGEAFRVNQKGDTIKIEEMRLEYTNNTYTFYARIFNQNEGREIAFKSKNKKFYFENAHHDFPKAIQYKFGLFSKKKMTACLYHPHKEKLPHRIPFRKIP